MIPRTDAEKLEWFKERYISRNNLGDFDNCVWNPGNNISEQFDRYALATFAEARELCIRKEQDYGSTWVTLGAKGLMVYLRAKAGRLWKLLWKGETAAVKDEAIRDTLIDLINYCLFILYCLDTGNLYGSDD